MMSSNYIADLAMILNPANINLRESQIMAIVNLTPDSFYAASRNISYEQVRLRVEQTISEGATIVDLGGYSSRPGAEDVSLDEEWERLQMGLEAVSRSEMSVVVSIDTFRSEIVCRAYEEYGPFIVNDISAGELDQDMLRVVARLGLPYIAMHMRGNPRSMSQLTEYEDGVVNGVRDYFVERTREMLDAGISPNNIILDPGFGFAKTTEQNMELLGGLGAIRELGYPLLVGVSRKSMIYLPLGITSDEALAGSLALAWEALRGGDAILRVHDVRESRQVVDLFKYYKSAAL